MQGQYKGQDVVVTALLGGRRKLAHAGWYARIRNDAGEYNLLSIHTARTVLN